jgi:hypothetical protein
VLIGELQMHRVTRLVSVTLLLLVSWAHAMQTAQKDGKLTVNQRVVDIRDWGVDCSGTLDATAILNNHSGEAAAGFDGKELQIPPGCITALARQALDG